MLSLHDVTVDYRRGRLVDRALDVPRLDVAEASVVGVIGETGSGKTTLVRTILGLVPVGTGTIELDGQTISGLRGAELRRFRRGGSVRYVHQDTLGSLDPEWTIRRSLREPFTVGPRSTRADRAVIDERVAETFDLLNLEPALLALRPAALSGGQRQRVNLARALMFEPRLLLLDEPTSALDSLNRALVVDAIHRLRSRRVSTLVISHDLTSLFDVVDRVVVLYRGRIVEENAVDRLLAEPAHPYTRLLLASVPSLFAESITPAERRALRAEVDAVTPRV